MSSLRECPKRKDYAGVFQVAAYEYEVRISKFKTADLIWRLSTWFFGETNNFARIRLGVITRRFLRSLITNLKIKNGGSNVVVEYMNFWWNFDYLALIRLETVTLWFLRSLIMNLKSESPNSKWRIEYGD